MSTRSKPVWLRLAVDKTRQAGHSKGEGKQNALKEELIPKGTDRNRSNSVCGRNE